MNQDNRKRASGLLALMGIVVMLAPILYFLSLGPAAYLHDRGDLSDETAEAVYFPIMLLADRSETFGNVCDRYCEWFCSFSDGR
jgi:hypothetical protein